ncbi:MAG TPA: FliG C-terminal domain-containing protein [Rhodopila sp.]|uniref:FliG C-terminal domain-containing protein n=1 Tax=Rhodopila sp. TaxID=2480087 RepID=UPI002B82958A|nr:FliG C-terminal domain-containing protein [Rhodopila sp.]HVY15641.1 FliG C-terminal domain-containing protein [Rhodopila sp.]
MPRSLSPHRHQHASLVGALIDQAQAAALVPNLDRNSTEALINKVARADTAEPKALYAACRDFITRFGLQQRQISSLDAALRQVTDGIGAEDERTVSRQNRNSNVWTTVAAVGDEILASYLKGEYPQTAAVILSMIDPNLAAKIIRNFPDDLTADILYRLLHLESVKSDLLTSIAVSLRAEIYTPLQGKAKHTTTKLVATILNNLDSADSTRYLDVLRARSVELTEQVEAHMFTFDDLLSLAPEYIQAIVASVDKDLLCVALKSASADSRKIVTSQMSTRGAKAFEAQFANLGRVKLKDVNFARNQILGYARELAAQGLIDLDKSADDVSSP